MCPIDAFFTFFKGYAGEFIAAFGGAGFGALSAYLFQQHQQKKADSEKRYSALLEAKMVLGFHLNSLLNLRDKVLGPFLQDENRAFAMGLQFKIIDRTKIDLRQLSFLTHGSNNPNLVMMLYLAESRYFNTVEAFDERNRAVRDTTATAIITHYDPNTKKASVVSDIPKIQLLKDTTEHLFECVPSTVDFLKSVMIQLDKVSTFLFPDRKPVRFTTDDKPKE